MKHKRILSGLVAFTLVVTQGLSTGIPAVAAPAPDAPQAYGPTPSEAQMKYYKDELAAFFHFGVNTYTDMEWGNGQEDPDIFNPTKLDTDQWIRTVQEAGMKRAILTAKHHDGFNLYPTKVTDHSVESSSWRDGKGDVVQEFVDSCTKYDMDIGFYLSPWDQNLPSYPSNVAPDYNDTYIQQMNELFAYSKQKDNGYSDIVEFWMDGANGNAESRPKYDLQRWWDNLEAHNPNIVYQQNYGAPLHWCGNERGYSSDECWHILNKEYVWNLYDQYGQEDSAYLHTGEPYIEGKPEGERNGDTWSISEVDVSIRPGWFYHANQSPKTAEELANIYFTSVGLGSPLLLNVPPTPEGLIDERDVESLRGFREILDNTFSRNLADGATAEATATRGNHQNFGAANVLDDDYDTYWTMDDGQTTGSVTVTLDQPTLLDVVQIQEYIPLGQRIASFRVDVRVGGQWMEFGSGKTIGYKRLMRGAPVVADAVRVTVTDALATPLINNISVFKADERIALEAQAVPGQIQAESCDQLVGAISENKGPNGGGNLGAVTDGSYAKYERVRFDQTPTAFTLSHSGGGTPQITLRLDSQDGPILAQMQVPASGSYFTYVETTVPVTYQGEPLSGYHDIYLCMNAGLNIDWFRLEGQNTLNFQATQVTAYEGDAVQLTVTRSDEDLSEEVQVQVQTVPDTAVSGQDYAELVQTITFAPNETSKTVTVQTMESDLKEYDTKFRVELSSPSANAMLGTGSACVVTIRDNDGPADLEQLQAAVDQANGKVESDYMPDSWAAFVALRDQAIALLANPEATQRQVDEMTAALNQAMEALEPFQYTQDNPCQLSTTETVEAEAELFTLLGCAGIYSRPGDSGGKEVEEMGLMSSGEEGQLQCSFDVPAAGDYNIRLRYFSGAQNTIYWGNGLEGEDQIAGRKVLDFDGQAQFYEVDLPIHFSQAGVNTITFYNHEAGTCNLDKFTISCLSTAQPGDKTLLQATYDYALTLSTQGVTDAAKEAFETALANAKAVLDNPSATQDEINAAWDALLEGIWGLGLTQGDKTMLEQLISKAEDMMDHADQYVADHWQQLVEALAEAKKVMNDGNAMEEDVQPAAQALLDAILAQRFKADKSILEALIQQAEGMDLTGYTAQSVATFRTALANAQAVMVNNNLSEDDQAVVDKAVAQLTAAMDGLTASGAPETTDKPEASQKPEATQKPENKVPQTGDNAALMLWSMAGAISLVGVACLVYRKNKLEEK